MVRLDPALMHLVRQAPVEVVENYVLQHVRVVRRPERDGFEITDLYGTTVGHVTDVVMATRRPAEVITKILMDLVVCSVCRERLLEGEEGTCTLCEARQVKELRAMLEQLR